MLQIKCPPRLCLFLSDLISSYVVVQWYQFLLHSRVSYVRVVCSTHSKYTYTCVAGMYVFELCGVFVCLGCLVEVGCGETQKREKGSELVPGEQVWVYHCLTHASMWCTKYCCCSAFRTPCFRGGRVFVLFPIYLSTSRPAPLICTMGHALSQLVSALVGEMTAKLWWCC